MDEDLALQPPSDDSNPLILRNIINPSVLPAHDIKPLPSRVDLLIALNMQRDDWSQRQGQQTAQDPSSFTLVDVFRRVEEDLAMENEIIRASDAPSLMKCKALLLGEIELTSIVDARKQLTPSKLLCVGEDLFPPGLFEKPRATSQIDWPNEDVDFEEAKRFCYTHTPGDLNKILGSRRYTAEELLQVLGGSEISRDKDDEEWNSTETGFIAGDFGLQSPLEGPCSTSSSPLKRRRGESPESSCSPGITFLSAVF